MPAPDVHDVVDAYWLDRRRRGHDVISLPPFFLRPVFLLRRRYFMRGGEFSYYFNSVLWLGRARGTMTTHTYPVRSNCTYYDTDRGSSRCRWHDCRAAVQACQTISRAPEARIPEETPSP
jgi:hypothetical protein